MEPVYLASLALRWMHILSAIALMGGAFFMRFALLPAASTLDAAAHDQLRSEVRKRWAKWVMMTTTFLIVSGLINVAMNEMRFQFDGPIYRMLLAVKILLAMPVFYIAMSLVGQSPVAEKMRANAEKWLTLNLVLATAIVAIGGGMRFIDRTKKAPKGEPAAAAVAEQR